MFGKLSMRRLSIKNLSEMNILPYWICPWWWVFSEIINLIKITPKYFFFTFYIFILYLSLYPEYIVQWALNVLKGPFRTPNCLPPHKIKRATIDQILFSIYKYNRNMYYTPKVLFLYGIPSCKSSPNMPSISLFYNLINLEVIYSQNLMPPFHIGEF